MSTKTAVKPAAQAPAPLLTATKDQLAGQYDDLANGITSINAGVTMKLTAGSMYTGVIEQYHEINGFVLAQKPNYVRVIGQVPIVGKDIFDMESDGHFFHIFVPSKNQFVVGSANLEQTSAKPIENLRPQHLVDAIFWQEISGRDLVLMEETSDASGSYYVLIVAARKAGANGKNETTVGDWVLARKIWFDRKDLNLARVQAYENNGKLSSDIRYSNWEMFGTAKYPRQIALSRPLNDYQLQIGVTKLTLNEIISPDRFELKQPAGTELVQVGEEHKELQP